MFGLLKKSAVMVVAMNFFCISLQANEGVRLTAPELEIARLINTLSDAQKGKKLKLFGETNYIYAADPEYFPSTETREVIYESVAYTLVEASSLVSYYSGMRIRRAPENVGDIVFIFTNDFRGAMSGAFRGVMEAVLESDVDEYVDKFSYDGSGCYTHFVEDGFEILGGVNFIEARLSPENMRKCIMLSFARSVGFANNI